MLWEKLKVEDDVQKMFTDSVQGLGMDTLMKGEVEVKRLHELKREKLGELIKEARGTIKQLWEEVSGAERSGGGGGGGGGLRKTRMRASERSELVTPDEE